MCKFAGSFLVASLFCTAASQAADTDQGATAVLVDTITPRSDTSVDFFILSKVDGKPVDNANTRTSESDRGRGFAMNPQNYDRRIPAAPVAVEITGFTHYAAPILMLMHGSRKVSGTENFTPQPDHSYEIKGVLQEGYCAVWIEDAVTATVVGQKFENKC